MAIVYDTYQREAQPQLSLLSAADPARVLAWRDGEAISAAQFLAHVQMVAGILPTAAAAVNLCEDRYAFLVAFCAIALRGQINVSIGWGTNLTNDFSGCAPAGVDGELRAISLVCKVVEADGQPAVKLSDNPNKAMGRPDEVERYRRVFGLVGMKATPVTV